LWSFQNLQRPSQRQSSPFAFCYFARNTTSRFSPTRGSVLLDKVSSNTTLLRASYHHAGIR
jgi:hypothetical protein